MRRLGAVPALDGVRGLAVLLVMIVHVQLLMPFRQTGVRFVDGFIQGGYLGVDLFFVLSGFLITALLLDESNRRGAVRFGRFYLRRALRLLPALYVLLLAHYVYFRIEGLPWESEWATLRSAVLYVSNWQGVVEPYTVAHELTQLWSLAIEEQFYLWWPALVMLFFGPRKSARTVAWALGAIIVGVAAWRAYLLHTGVLWTELTVRTDTRIDGLLIGALLASLWVRRATPTKYVDRAAWVALGVLFACVATFRGPSDIGYQGGLTVFALAGAVVILALVNGTWGGRWLFEIRPLRALGRVSYGVYLWHYPIFFVVAIKCQDLPDLPRLGVALALTAVATLTSWYLVERPALALKARFGGHRTPEGESVREAAPTMALAPVPLPGWDTERGRTLWAAVGVAALVAAVAFVQVAADDPDPNGPGGLDFPTGDTDRVSYWNLVELEPRVIDSFERADSPTSLTTADSGVTWAPARGTWGVEDRRAIVAPAEDDAPRLAVLTQPERDGLVEVTLTTMAEGAGLLVRYEDPDNWWAVIARPSSGRWSVIQAVDGEPVPIAEFAAPTDDGTTVSVTQHDVLLRVLVDGVEHATAGVDTLEPPFQSGLVAIGDEAHGARWDRYLVMRFKEDDPLAGGAGG
jgi:peptidoglycan/LPS O-acetylase OafA/YrhL